jgi:endonuclease/exonuclease/phosphatase family metal-dependent hydrolase
MTQNLDEGTDFTPLFTATSLPAFAAAATAIFGEVVASDIPARAGLVAREIAAAAPEVVSVQEASLWQWQSPAGPASIDALAALERALAADGARYAVVSVLDEFSGAAPVAGIGQVSFLDRDALLVRAGQPPGHLRVSDIQSGHYATVLSAPTVAGTVTIPRGWISADLTIQGRTVRVIATHLESFSAAVQQAQGEELVAGPASTRLPVIIAGDLNTGPLAGGGFVTPTYQQILQSGFTDTWPVTNPGVPGMTNPFHAEDPYGPSVPDKRIDLVLVKGNLRPVSDALVGTSPVDGLWPSDHAGLIARIQIPS